MKESDEFARKYEEALAVCLSGGEDASINPAYGLGQRARWRRDWASWT